MCAIIEEALRTLYKMRFSIFCICIVVIFIIFVIDHILIIVKVNGGVLLTGGASKLRFKKIKIAN